MFSSSEWIDDTLSPARGTSRENYTTLRKVITDTAQGCRDAGANENEALFFVWGMFGGQMPYMWTLFATWIKEVYSEET